MENGGLTPNIEPVSRRDKTFGSKPRGIIDVMKDGVRAAVKRNTPPDQRPEDNTKY